MDYQSMAIDVIELYAKSDTKKWNIFLTNCLMQNDLKKLINTRIGIQVGMSNAVKEKLTTDKINETYCRWIGSIDRTARSIIKKLNPMPGDNAYICAEEFETEYWINAKKKRDNDFEKFLIRSSY